MDKNYDHIKAEKDAQELWHAHNVYTTENNPGPLYSIDTPPPTISGSLHIGHIFSYTQTDIIARFKRMSGYSVFYPFGFDDNGLATERFVEKKLNVEAYTMARSEFITLCLRETGLVEKEFEALWRRVGLSVDWSLCYSTIDENTRKISQASFIELYKKGHIYRKDEPALYCTNCRTTVAQAELDDSEKPGTFNSIAFKSDGRDLVIGTTRPELLPSCVALLYHPDDNRYKSLKGKKATVPIFNYEVPILEDTEVDPQKGTGLVMCCTFGDKTDISWFKKFNLPYRPSIGTDGKFLPQTGPLAGMRVPTARKTILELLAAQNLLLEQKPITHAVNVHERCKKEIEYLVLTQWFLKILPYKEHFLKLADEIKWFPSFMKSRYKNWVENISWDWCLSRQRFYGIPFPVWYCKDCGEILLPEEKDLPVDPQETLYKGTCASCKSSTIVPDTDVMDTWNTSSLTPYICTGLYKKNFDGIFDQSQIAEFMPMSMRAQAHDIIRTWAFYTIVKSALHNNIVPWNTIIISGHVLSNEKEKISKSRGNTPLTPESLLEKYPADAIRYWTASGSLGHDIAFSDNQLAIGQKLLVKLWNAFRFAQPYLSDIKNTQIKDEQLTLVNQWILDSISRCYTQYTNYFAQYEFGLALDTIEKFFWHDFCDNYLELIKDQLMNPDKYNPTTVEATRSTLYTVGLRILQLYAPFLPHISETLYATIYSNSIKTKSIHQTRFEAHQKIYSFEQNAFHMHKLLNIIGTVRKLKSEQKISLKTDIASLLIYTQDPELREIVTAQETLLKGITRALEIRLSQTAPTENMIEQKDGAWHIAVIC